MTRIANKIRYLKSCYQADLRAVSLLNFYGRKASHQLLLDSFEPVSGKEADFPISTEWSEAVDAHMTIHAKEKALYCGAIFLAGKVNIAGKKENLLAPLFLYPTELLIDTDGVYYIAVDTSDPIINPAVLHVFSEKQQGIYEKLYDNLPKGRLNFDAVDVLEKTIAKYFPEIDATQLQKLPSLIFSTDLPDQLKQIRKAGRPEFLPVVGLCIMEKQAGSRGILNELDEMAGEKSFSNPIKVLFREKENFEKQKSFDIHYVPALLSETQSKIVRNGLKYPISLVVGPPGTGKSYTIAALASQCLANRKSVLIVSKNVEAVEVVANKIEQDLALENIVIRASRKGFRKAAQVRLKEIALGFDFSNVFFSQIKNINYNIDKKAKRIEKIKGQIIEEQKKLLPTGEFLFEYSGGFMQRLKKRWLEKKHERKTPIWKLVAEMEKLMHSKRKLTKEYIQKRFYYFMEDAFKNYRYDLTSLNKAMKARTGTKKAEHFEEADFGVLLKALPIWTVSLSDVHKVLPLQKNLFDLVIIDEATQCDMASCLPVIQRGKSCLVVGDPKQLRHLSFLSREKQRLLAEQFDIGYNESQFYDYREKSLLDLVDDRLQNFNSLYFLNEHYRSMPDIISFSNEHFYRNRLHIMTDNIQTKYRKHNFIEEINGKRYPSGYNKMEADAILKKIESLAAAEINLEKEVCQSIGIVSPFRSQVDHLRKKAAKTLSPEIVERHKVMIGTPFSFQGEERDVIFISFVLDDNSHHSALQYLNRQDVFNVAITRARICQFNCISFSINGIKHSTLLGKYLAHAKSATAKIDKENKELPADEFLLEIKEVVAALEHDELHTAYEIAGVKLDILIVKDGKCCAIDLVGYPGDHEEMLTVESWSMIYRIGIPVFYLPYSYWVFDKAKTKRALREFINKI
ncbi:MAG: AAA domain-containing protein [Bacteroidota bacterium]